MLNVQDQRDFSCSTLNRDVWKDETIKEIIKANFVFVQVIYKTKKAPSYFYLLFVFKFGSILTNILT